MVCFEGREWSVFEGGSGLFLGEKEGLFFEEKVGCFEDGNRAVWWRRKVGCFLGRKRDCLGRKRDCLGRKRGSFRREWAVLWRRKVGCLGKKWAVWRRKRKFGEGVVCLEGRKRAF